MHTRRENIKAARTIEQEGINSFYAGFSLMNNPHPKKSVLGKRWISGFNEAKADPIAKPII